MNEWDVEGLKKPQFYLFNFFVFQAVQGVTIHLKIYTIYTNFKLGRTDSYSSLEKNSSKGDIFKSDVSLISTQSSSPQLNNSAGSDHSSGRKSIDELRDMRKSADELRKDSLEKNHVKGNEPCASVGNLLNGQR